MVDLSTREGAKYFTDLLADVAGKEKIEDIDHAIPNREDNPVEWLEAWKQLLARDPSELKWLTNLRDSIQAEFKKDHNQIEDIQPASLKYIEAVYIDGMLPDNYIANSQDDLRKYIARELCDDTTPSIPNDIDSIDESATHPQKLPDSVEVIIPPKMASALAKKRFGSGIAELAAARNAECERIEEIIRTCPEKYFGDAHNVVSVGDTVQNESIIVGRVIGEDSNQPLSIHTLLLEGNHRFSNNKLVALKLDHLSNDSRYYLYPGKIIACLGVCSPAESSNALKTFDVYKIRDALAPIVEPPKPLAVAYPDEAVDICIAGGPFVPHDCGSLVDFNRITKVCSKMRSIAPSVAVIVGPFIPTNHPIATSASGVVLSTGRGVDNNLVSYPDIYTKFLQIIQNELVNHGIRTIVVPHCADIVADGPMPQRGYDHFIRWPSTSANNIEFQTNPCYLNANGMGIVIVGQDIHHDLAPMNIKGQALTNSKKKIFKMTSEVVEQGTLICGAMHSGSNFLADDDTVQSLALKSGIEHELNEDLMDPHLILHSMMKSKRPPKLMGISHDRAVGSISEMLMHIRINPKTESSNPGYFIDEFNNPGRCMISTLTSEK